MLFRLFSKTTNRRWIFNFITERELTATVKTVEKLVELVATLTDSNSFETLVSEDDGFTVAFENTSLDEIGFARIFISTSLLNNAEFVLEDGRKIVTKNGRVTEETSADLAAMLAEERRRFDTSLEMEVCF